MPWKTMDVQEQRVQFVVAAGRREKSFSALCQEFGISRPTGYCGYNAINKGSRLFPELGRRPWHSPQQTARSSRASGGDEAALSGLGSAQASRIRLQEAGVALTRSTIHRILERHDLLHPADRHQHAVQRFERARPNELWQMDFKSPLGWNAPVGPLSVIDDHSRYVMVLQALGSTRAELVREQLESAFAGCGVPQAMLMDHGVPWWSWAGPQAAPTGLALWLMKQGIGLHWSGIGHPQTQGKVERFHGELERALQRRGWQGKPRQQWLDEFRWEHNHLRPHEALDMATPASRWQPSSRRYDPQPPRWEYPEGSWVLQVDCQGKLDLAAQEADHRARPQRRAGAPAAVEHRLQVYYCNTLIRELDFEIQRSTMVERWISD